MKRRDMGRVEGMKDENGIKYLFNSNDHMPLHFHTVDSGGAWNIRVFFLDCSESFLAYEYKFPPPTEPDTHPLPRNQQNEILRKMALLNETDENGNQITFKQNLLKQWSEKVLPKDLHKESKK